MTKFIRIMVGLILGSIILFIVAIINYHMQTQSAVYVDELGITRLEDYPSAIFVGGKAFGWFVEQVPAQNAVIVNVFSESGNFQGRYELLLSESKHSILTVSDIIFFNDGIFTLSDGSFVNSRQISR